MDELFNVSSMDIWYPGSTKTNTATTKNQKAVLTCLDNLSGFTNLAFSSSQVSLEMIARLTFSHFLVPNELPKLMVISIDIDSEIKGIFAQCANSWASHATASPT